MSLRVAMLSVHTSPLHQPGTGDAGGMNVYMVQLSRALAEQGIEVDLFTRCRGEGRPSQVDLAPGVRVRHLHAGPRAALPKEDMPGLVVPFSLALMKERRRYDLVHSHYWLSGQAGRIAAAGWGIPLVHTAHTLGLVKNAALAAGDTPEPELRIRGEQQVTASADRLIANTADEAGALRGLYGASAPRVDVVRPGVDLDTFHPGDGRAAARARLGLPTGAFIPVYAGRIQPLKGPDVLVRAVAELLRTDSALRSRLLVPVVGGHSGAGPVGGPWDLARELGVADVLRCLPPVVQAELADWYRAADVLAVPSRSESFGLVALEAQACGTPVLAAAVGGLPTAVGRGDRSAGARPRSGGLRPLPAVVRAASRGRREHGRGRGAPCAGDELAGRGHADAGGVSARTVCAAACRNANEAGATARSCLTGASLLEGGEGRNTSLTSLLV